MKDPATPSQTISKGDLYHLLQNPRRRAVLRYLLAHADREQFRMRDLAEEIGAWEHDTTVQALTSDQRQSVYIALYQSHLPKLDAHGIILYDQNRVQSNQRLSFTRWPPSLTRNSTAPRPTLLFPKSRHRIGVCWLPSVRS